MEFTDALKQLRAETGLTQKQLAQALHIGYATLNRWENRRCAPNRAGAVALLAFAQSHRVSAACLAALQQAQPCDPAAPGTGAAQVPPLLSGQLTDGQFAALFEHLDFAVFALRIPGNALDKAQLLYFNRRLTQALACSAQDLVDTCRQNLFYYFHPADQPRCQAILTQLLRGQVLDQSSRTKVRVLRADHVQRWMRLQVVYQEKSAAGTTLFITGRDVTEQEHAQSKYRSELAYRMALMQECLVWAHCSVTQNCVLQGDSRIPDFQEKLKLPTMDELTQGILQRISATGKRRQCRQLFGRSAMADAFSMGSATRSEVYYDTPLRRWVRLNCFLIENPATAELEALLCLQDAQQQTRTQLILDGCARHFFDYILCIDVETGTYESCYLTDKPRGMPARNARCYVTGYARQIHRSILPADVSLAMRCMELGYVQRQLEVQPYFSFIARVKDPDGSIRPKKFMYRYLDASRHRILLARSDIQDLHALMEALQVQEQAFWADAKDRDAAQPQP